MLWNTNQVGPTYVNAHANVSNLFLISIFQAHVIGILFTPGDEPKNNFYGIDNTQFYPVKGGASKRKIRRLTKTFPYCQDWRKSAGLETDYKIKIN